MTLLRCEDCGDQYRDFEVLDEVWAQVATLEADATMDTCLPCFERDLHRAIVVTDFTSSACNQEYIRHCDNCDEIFRFVQDQQWYCSAKCGEEAGWAVKVDCLHCGLRFIRGRKGQSYCSRLCAQADKRVLLTKVCVGCGDDFDTYRVHQIYCSKSCSLNAHKAEEIKLECPICHDSFIATSKRVKYCGKAECRREGFNRTRRKVIPDDTRLLFEMFIKWLELNPEQSLRARTRTSRMRARNGSIEEEETDDD